MIISEVCILTCIIWLVEIEFGPLHLITIPAKYSDFSLCDKRLVKECILCCKYMAFIVWCYYINMIKELLIRGVLCSRDMSCVQYALCDLLFKLNIRAFQSPLGNGSTPSVFGEYSQRFQALWPWEVGTLLLVDDLTVETWTSKGEAILFDHLVHWITEWCMDNYSSV